MEKLGFSEEDYELYKNCFKEDISKLTVVAKDDVYQIHDKTFKEILKDKGEMSQFLKSFIGLEVKASDLEIYNCSFITKDYHRRDSDIVYKQTEKETYYIIEHQSKVDKKMPRRILEYCVELMREVKRNDILESNPLIIPIVIYTGENKWTVATDFSSTQMVEEKNKKYVISLKYELIDINELNKEELKKIDNRMSILMLLEKSKNELELSEELKEIAAIVKDENKKIWISNLVAYIYASLLGAEQTREILKILYGKDRKMEDLIERFKRNARLEAQKNIKIGIKENLMLTIKNMLKYNEDEEKIMKYTNATKKEIEIAKREMQDV